jgi:competence ComEA-like helix-hairpin-helix protein
MMKCSNLFSAFNKVLKWGGLNTSSLLLVLFFGLLLFILLPQHGPQPWVVSPHPAILQDSMSLPVLQTQTNGTAQWIDPTQPEATSYKVLASDHAPKRGRHPKPGKKNFTGVLSLNTASSQALQQISGIGPKMADRIIAYRKQHGSFHTLEELMNVSGIGPKKYAKMQAHLKL